MTTPHPADAESASTNLVRGAEGTQVGPSVIVMRLWIEPTELTDKAREHIERGEALLEFFSPQSFPSDSELSVWAEGLTTLSQAWHFTGAVGRWVARLPVWEINLIRGEAVPPKCPASPNLQVIWRQAERRVDGAWVPDFRPGTEGHAAIIHFHKKHTSDGQRRQIRNLLVDLASRTGVRFLYDHELTHFRTEC